MTGSIDSLGKRRKALSFCPVLSLHSDIDRFFMRVYHKIEPVNLYNPSQPGSARQKEQAHGIRMQPKLRALSAKALHAQHPYIRVA